MNPHNVPVTKFVGFVENMRKVGGIIALMQGL
jgi:hypothetical protein